MSENFIVYHKTKFNDYLYYDYNSDEFHIGAIIPRNTNAYYLISSYASNCNFGNLTNEEINDKMKTILKEYANDLIKWSEDLKASKVLKAPVDYMKSVTLKSGKQFYRSHYEMVFTFFKMYCGPISKTNFDLANENIFSFIESRWYESCYNGGLTYLKQAKQIYKNIYGYDFKQFYPSLMSSKKFLIPTDEGTEQILSMMPQKLKFGLYRCKISVDDDWDACLSANLPCRDDVDFTKEHFKMMFLLN